MSYELILYSQDQNPECELVVRYLLNRGIEFEERDIAKKEWSGMVRELGYTRVPILYRDWNKTYPKMNLIEHTCGFNLMAIDRMIKDLTPSFDYED